MTKRQLLSIMFYHIGHNVDRLLWMTSPTNEWVGDKLADLYQWAMRKSAEYDDYYKVWKKVDWDRDIKPMFEEENE